MANFRDEINEEAKKYGGGVSSDFYSFERGVNKIRILVQPKVIATHFFGEGVPAIVCIGINEDCKYHKEGDKRPGIKLATYIIERKMGKIKLAELPLSISYAINDLQEDDDFAFSEFPMPYDVKITYDPDNADPKAKYRLVASPNKSDITDDERGELAGLMAKMSPEQYVEIRKAKQKAKNAPPVQDVYLEQTEATLADKF